MAQRFLVHDQPVPGSATHAIVIGVGTYPHLNGGTDALRRNTTAWGSFTSPPISARTIANWLILFRPSGEAIVNGGPALVRGTRREVREPPNGT